MIFTFKIKIMSYIILSRFQSLVNPHQIKKITRSVKIKNVFCDEIPTNMIFRKSDINSNIDTLHNNLLTRKLIYNQINGLKYHQSWLCMAYL